MTTHELTFEMYQIALKLLRPARRRTGYTERAWQRYWKQNMALAQRVKCYTVKGRDYTRVPYGQESWWQEDGIPTPLDTCPDCAVARGKLHVIGCDQEMCPKDKHQWLACGCMWK